MAQVKKKKSTELSQHGLTMNDLARDNWINTPNGFLGQMAHMTVLQQDVMLAVSEKLKKYIGDYFDEGRHHHPDNPNPAIPQEMINKEDMPELEFKFSQIADPKHYYLVKDAVDSLAQLNVRAFNYKEGGSNNKRIKEITQMPIFSKITYAMKELSKSYTLESVKKGDVIISEIVDGSITAKINYEVAAYLLDMKAGYMNHLVKIAHNSTKQVTTPVYFMLKQSSDWGKLSPQYTLDFVRQCTGHDVHEGQTVIPYPKFSMYCKKVLDVAKEDLDRMAKLNETEITFNYTPIYRGTAKRGNPEYIRFDIIITPLGQERIYYRKNKKLRPELQEKFRVSELLKQHGEGDLFKKEDEITKRKEAANTDEAKEAMERFFAKHGRNKNK